MTFKNAVLNTPVEARTWNGMKALQGTLSNTTDLFYKIGASRGRDVTAEFERAYQEDREVALRVVQWARDVRGGAGERELFRAILRYLEKRDPKATCCPLPSAIYGTSHSPIWKSDSIVKILPVPATAMRNTPPSSPSSVPEPNFP